MHALQESQDAAVNNPGSAYGASPLGPGAGSAAGNTPGHADAHAGTKPEPMPSQPLQDGDTAVQVDGEGNQAGGKQQGLALPFEPVALVFKDIHYYVKQGGGDLELLRVRLCQCLACRDSCFARGALHVCGCVAFGWRHVQLACDSKVWHALSKWGRIRSHSTQCAVVAQAVK